MTDSLKLAAQKALEALEKSVDNFPANVQHRAAIADLTAALQHQEEREPAAAWLRDDGMKAMPADEKNAWIEAGQPEIAADYTTPLFLRYWTPAMIDKMNALAAELDATPPLLQKEEGEALPVEWTSKDGESHCVTLDYAARICRWMFDTYGGVDAVDAAIATRQGEKP